ncbi:hypothetical protein [Mesorhizobium sp. WSM2239]|uniref:Uncharacterized protein n=2 Tax=unclassified Mesorhizobium TaxID=325217 RepID=A0AAU8D8G0_9HYPH
MKLLLATAFSVVLAISGAAYAQTQPDAGGTDNEPGGGGSDASNYLAGPNIHQFYTDESMATMRPEAEIRTTYEALTEADRASLKASCETNTDVKFTDLCRAVNAM